MILREISGVLAARLKTNPAVALLGPRQCGKTTLARSLAEQYFDLEQDADRLKLDVQWDALCRSKKLVVLDEIQAHPEVMPRLRGAIDADRRRNGRFLLLGSVAPAIMHQVSESLAGRLALLELNPISVLEVGVERLDDLWLRGGFPDGGVLDASHFPRWQLDYLDLLTQRDLPTWGLPSRPQTTQRLLKMLAAIHGQLWNASQLGKSLGINYATVNSYLEYLQGAYMIRMLPPFHANLRKRVVKSPKCYWRDSGLLHAMIGIQSQEQLLSQPIVGLSWESFVIEQLLTRLRQLDVLFNAYFFRTNDQYEIDLVLEIHGKLWAIEIKLTSNPTRTDLAALNKTADLIDATHRILVSRTSEEVSADRVSSLSLTGTLELMEKTLVS
ncbi:MAG: ATP-binding protein [Planctomycetota bacterium]